MTRRPSITFRLASLFAAAAAVVLLGIGFVIVGATEAHFAEMDLHELHGKLALTRHALEGVRTPEHLHTLPLHLNDALVGHEGLSVVVRSTDGTPIFVSEGAGFAHALLDRPAIASEEPVLWESDGHLYRGIVGAAPLGLTGTEPASVAIALDVSFHREFIAAFRHMLWLAIGGGIVTMALLGWWIARRGIRPVSKIAETVDRIGAGQLRERIAEDEVPAELVGLARSFNDLLARLEDSFRRLSDFSSDIAHELRTPVNTLMTQAEVALTKPRSATEYRDVLHSCLEEYERLARMIADMLFLAKADNNLIVPHREKVDLTDEVRELFEFYEALADEKNIRMTYSGGGIVSGDRLMLRRAVSNLLSNAIRHTPTGGHIKVRLSDSESAKVTLAVENSGDDIPAEHLPRLFDRFYRVAASRQRSGEGAGLGLAITRSIARAHGGDAFVCSGNGATTFELQIPVLPSESSESTTWP